MATIIGPRIRTSTTYVHAELETDVEIPEGPSETVPDMAMSLPELLSRYTRGLPVPQKEPYYSDEEFPDLERLDLSEIQELKEAARDTVAQLRQELEKAEFMKRKTVAAEQKATWDRKRNASVPDDEVTTVTDSPSELA